MDLDIPSILFSFLFFPSSFVVVVVCFLLLFLLLLFFAFVFVCFAQPSFTRCGVFNDVLRCSIDMERAEEMSKSKMILTDLAD